MSSFTAEDGFIDITGDGGILKKITQEGEGDHPQTGDEVRAHYTGGVNLLPLSLITSSALLN